jgi:signal transduction histidine kinase
MGVMVASFNLSAQINVDSLEEVLRSRELPTEDLLRIYDDLSNECRKTNTQKSFDYAWLEYRLAQKDKNPYRQGQALHNLAKAHNAGGVADSSLYYFDAAFRQFEQLNEERETAKIRVERSGIKIQQFRYDEALKDLQTAQDYFERTGDESLIPLILLRKGSIYLFSKNEFDMAEKCYIEALAVEERLGTTHHTGVNLANLATVKGCQGDFDAALDYCNRSIEYLHRDGDLYNEGRMWYIKASLLIEADRENENAIDYLNKAMKIAEEIDNPSLKEEVMRGKADYYLKTKQFSLAQKEAEAAFVLADTTSYSIMAVYKYFFTRSAIYLAKPDEAIRHLTDYITFLEKQQSEEMAVKTSEMEVQYETEKKELKISSLEEEKRTQRWLGVATATALLLAFGLLFYRHRLNLNKRRLAEQELQQLKQAQQLIATQAVFDGETQERNRLARDLHDGLGSILAAAKYNLTDIKKASVSGTVDAEHFNKAINLLDDSMREMRRVAHHLMPESLSKYGLKASLTDFCNSVPCVNFTYYGEEARFDSKTEVMVYRIVHELVTNALKHSGASHILVQIIRDTESIALTVQDDGCGFDVSDESKGMGLQNIRTRVAAYNGSLLLDSQVGVGTEVNVEFIIENKQVIY